MGDIIPFRNRKEVSQPTTSNRTPQASRRLKPPVPQEEIERRKHLADATFLAPAEFSKSISDLSDVLRSQALRRETGLLGAKMAYDHRVVVLVSDEALEQEPTYRDCFELKKAVDKLTAKFGRAAVYNAKGALVRFNHTGESRWERDQTLKKECLYLRPTFREDEVEALLAPRLQTAGEYTHDYYDVSYRNR
jgi:hypothetical protein